MTLIRKVTVFENHRKMSHSTLRAKRAKLTFWVAKISLKMPQMVKNCQNLNETFWVIFKQCAKMVWAQFPLLGAFTHLQTIFIADNRPKSIKSRLWDCCAIQQNRKAKQKGGGGDDDRIRLSRESFLSNLIHCSVFLGQTKDKVKIGA